MSEPRNPGGLLVVIAGPGGVEFERSGPGAEAVPIPLPVDNLRDAARWATAIEPDRAEVPLPLLCIDVAGAAPAGSAILFPADGRLLAGLIADAARVTAVAGAVVVGVPAADRPALRAVVIEALAGHGFRATGTVDGWRAAEPALARTA